MLTLSLVMIPCDWIGIVTIRNETRRMRCTNGTTEIRPGPRASSFTFPRLNTTARSYCLMMYPAIMALPFLMQLAVDTRARLPLVASKQLALGARESHPGDAPVRPRVHSTHCP